MVSGTTTLDAAAVLAGIRGARVAENRAAAEVLEHAVAWARMHPAADLGDAATWWAGRGQDTGIPLAGEGAPLVAEFAVAELATALGLSAESGRHLLAQALELAHRLPKLWARVRAGTLAPWRARRIAEETLALSPEAASWVDDQVAAYAHKTGPAQTQRLVEEAIARFMPDFAAERREAAADRRYLDIDHDQVSFAGTSRIHGELDLADALDLEDAVRRGADELRALGHEESLDARRSLAVGALARGQQVLELCEAVGGFEARCARTSTTDGSARTSTTDGSARTSTTDGRARTSTTESTGTSTREVVLYVHLSEDTPDLARLENAGGHLLTADQVAQWCGRPDTSRITVKPVIDLNAQHCTDGYAPPARLVEQVRLRDRTCVFPWCHRPARSCDLDHIVPFDAGGPPAQTSSSNLAALCRRHHRLKTHGGWTYTVVGPGACLWSSPHGYSYLRDRTGTEDLTVRPVDPPHRRTS